MPQLRARWPAIATGWAGLCVVVTSAGLILHLAVLGPHDPAVNRFFYTDAVLGLAFPVLGAVVARAAPGNLIGAALAAGGLVGLGAFGREWAYHGGVAGSLPLAAAAGWVANWAWVGYWVPVFVPLLFPDGRLPSRRWRPVAALIGLALCASAIGGAFRPGEIDGIESYRLLNPLGIGTNEGPFVALQSLIVLVVFVGLPLSLAAMVMHLRRAPARRAQIQWLALGFGSCVTLVAVAAALELGPPYNDILLALGFVSVAASMTIAMLRHGLFDVERVLNRSVVYAILSALGFGLYALAIFVAGSLGRDDPPAPALAAVVALLAASIRTRVQRLVDRTLFGYRREPLQAIERIGASSGADLKTLIDGLRDALRLPYVSVEPVDGRRPVSSGRPNGDAERFQVILYGRVVATMSVGHRYAGERFTDEEFALLSDATRRAATLLHSAELAEDLQRSRERLVIAREEERRRLRRDLHDGLGPSLAGMALQLDSFAGRLNGDDAMVEKASELRDQLQHAVTEVRHIVEGLGPGRVDELGFAEAVRQLCRLDDERKRVRVVLSEPLPDLPAAVEEAAYRIASEAVTNTLRHADAQRCDVEVAVSPPWLEVVIADDGRGFGPEARPGIGLESLRERASEIGGLLDVQSTPGRGTRVTARLPLLIP